jgi:predicted secreted protein
LPSWPDPLGQRSLLGPEIASLLAAAFIAGCGSGGGVRIFRNPAAAVTVKRGSTFALSLSENQSVGFTWQLTGTPAGAIDSAGDAYSSDDPDKTGSGGQHRFVFRARRAGREVIRFQRFFRGKPRERRTVAVTVQ